MRGTSNRPSESRQFDASAVATTLFARIAEAQSNQFATFRRSTSLSAQGVDKSVELPGPGVQRLGMRPWTAVTNVPCPPRPTVLSHPELKLCPPAVSRPDLHQDTVVHMFHRPYVDDSFVIPELHKTFSRPVQAPDSAVTHPVTATSGRRRERKYP